MNSELPISRKAFTLLELLISITLLALVSALIYGAFFQVSNSSLKVKEIENRIYPETISKLI